MITILAMLLTAQPATITVYADQRKPISKYIYGANFPDWKGIGFGYTLARLGGNRTTAYNWETNASNAGADYRHQNDGYMGESDVPGKTYLDFMRDAQRNQAAVLLTIPTAGYVSADKGPDGDVNKTPNYLQTRFHRSYAKKPGKLAYPPNTKDKAVYQDEFVAYLESRKLSNTPLWYSLDNEPDLWGHTHQRIWPKNPTYAQILANNIEFASGIKDVAKQTLIFGPANYGWQGFRTFQDAPDANGRDFLDFYLAGMRAAGNRQGRRLLDVLDIHWYPEAQGGGQRIAFGEDKPGTAEARIQASRSLWDPNYVETSWIAQTLGGKPIVLLPRVLGQIAKHYPNTKLAITEYDYGGGKNASGMIAQADVLGLFGRYGLFAATHWGISKDDPAQVAGFRAFINYDGKGGRFGDRGLAVSGQRPADNAVYASVDSVNRNRLTIVAINKTDAVQPMRLVSNGFTPRSSRAFAQRHDAPFNPRSVPATLSKGVVTLDSPPLSVVTVELTR
ncbi:MAG TPA: glycoside hydrolase family 44 protein [Fimbriimonas sp.]